MAPKTSCHYFLHLCDILDSTAVHTHIKTDLSAFNREAVAIVFSHPPYLDVIRFTEESTDLSHIGDIQPFTLRYTEAVANVWPHLKRGGIFVLVAGDTYRNGEVIPLGFTLMSAIRQHFACQLKGIVVKDIVGNRSKIGQEALWRYRALKWNTFLFKHEYIFVFRKK